ncbi:NmrA-like family domain-containing protein [Colletotrichum siamense]|uniref:NmrA-like family domain-containing protein n=1 Tax=Colletotrichum siamense TaxID=690259 RepID=UPI0018727E44|nr:NmrA-like family domain-containing protein [Colletotrichum siamense]KAF5485080.1 NmrA-like family domain-containing protein [Colletotrichum siamense]
MDANTLKIVAVIGGTGKSLHDNPQFRVRVISRDPSSAKAKKLADSGIDVVQADCWETDQLIEAFKGCWGVFINIDSDAPNFKQRIGPSELQMGKGIVDAAVKAGVKHAVHASLPAASELTKGEVPVLAFDDKSAISKYLLEPGKFETAAIVSAAWFLENAFDPKYTAAFGGFAMIKDAEGYLTWETPAMGNNPESVPWLAVADDYGDFVHGVFLDPQRWNGCYIHGVSDSSSFAEMTAKFEEVTGKPARYKEVKTGGLSAADEFKTKEVNGLFDLMQAIEGNFFNGMPTDHENARILKKAAAEARQSNISLKPMTLEQFFQKYAM